ncbi:MAG: DegT/DnrJ/EryC1/StrS family aminotransferase [Leptospiraceae bacterium]|nr:DegT/DnrJ/EryC1/StrS family aminotransferase [Leptospiraceae bacterium]
MSVPFIDLKRFEDGFIDSWMEKVRDLSENTRFIGGPEIEAIESTLRDYCGVKHAIGCANGTDALQLALRGAGVERGDIVLVPDLTFWATFEAVVNVGADPVTVDVSAEDLQLDFDRFKEACEKYKPKAAFIVHLYGWGSGRLEEFRKYALEQNIVLIEDGAQAFGVQKDGQSIYANAQISTISFYPAKVFGAAGDAGAVLTSDDEFASRIRSLENHGRTTHYSYGLVGWNSRMDSFQAAFLNLSFPHLEARLKSRRAVANQYREKLANLPIRVVNAPAGYLENGYLNVLIVDEARRPDLEKSMKEKGIGCGIVYPGPMSQQDASPKFLKGKVGGENAERICKSVLNLPLFPYMRSEEVDEVVDAVKAFYG